MTQDDFLLLSRIFLSKAAQVFWPNFRWTLNQTEPDGEPWRPSKIKQKIAGLIDIAATNGPDDPSYRHYMDELRARSGLGELNKTYQSPPIPATSSSPDHVTAAIRITRATDTPLHDIVKAELQTYDKGSADHLLAEVAAEVLSPPAFMAFSQLGLRPEQRRMSVAALATVHRLDEEILHNIFAAAAERVDRAVQDGALTQQLGRWADQAKKSSQPSPQD